MGYLPYRYIKLWMTDNNCQISQKEAVNDIIGKLTVWGGLTAAGNGENFTKVCKCASATCVNTFFRPGNVDLQNWLRGIQNEGDVLGKLISSQ